MAIWDMENIKKEALRYKSKTAFSKQSGSAYNAARRLGILNDVCSHMGIIRKKCTLESIAAEASTHSSRSEFKKNHPYYYAVSRKLGILDKVCSHMGDKKNQPHSIKYLKDIASKCDSIKEFEVCYPNEYAAIKRRKLINEIFSNTERLWAEKWNVISVKEEAIKYFTRSEFARANGSAYNAAHRLSVIDECFSHMKKAGGTSITENELFAIVKSKFPKAQKLRDRKAKIEGKPYIKGFDIDIYIPELRKGIEFDGTYWHSVEGLKRSRKQWSEEELINYHKTKDDYFKSKNISILHISQEDLDENKQAIIEKIFTFLT